MPTNDARALLKASSARHKMRGAVGARSIRAKARGSLVRAPRGVNGQHLLAEMIDGGVNQRILCEHVVLVSTSSRSVGERW
mmetsp:Transcript_2713/g.7426  ORF Transcript_2713/g.7426 Transcript_2713/m.7426 type:complete len:81 (+) Transcript_2713:476-718(+)